MVKVTVGEYEVLESGVVSIVDGSPIVLELTPSVIVKLFFNNDSSDKNQSNIRFVVNDGKVIEYTLTNFNNPLGTEFTQMAEIGFYNGRKLFFHVKVLGNANEKNKTVFYSFYLGGQLTNGGQ